MKLLSVRDKLHVVTALVGVLLLLTAGLAFGEAEAESPTSYPTVADLEATLAGDYELEGPETNPEAAEQLPHVDLSRQEAEYLLDSVFGDHLQEQTEGLSEAEDVSTFYSDYAGVVDLDGPASDHVLVDSLLPLRAKTDEGVKEPVDLGLEATEQGNLQPVNPLVELEIPSELGQGIELPGTGIEIHLAGAPSDRTPSKMPQDVAFYPNVGEDTDLVVAPTPTGFETQTQIRSPEAPQTQTFVVSMPADGSLQASAEGGAKIVRDGEDLVRIPPPTAMDAEGNPVDVRLTVQGTALTVAVEADGAAFPILVDPVYESAWFWAQTNQTSGMEQWAPYTQSDRYAYFSRGNYGEPGLNIYSYPGPVAVGAQAGWQYYVPRYASDYANFNGSRPSSYIHKLTFTDLWWWIEEVQPFKEQPFLMMGLWDEKKGWWNRVGTRNGLEGQLLDPSWKYDLENVPQPDGSPTVYAKVGSIQMANLESTSRPRHLLVGQASVQLGDLDDPEFEQIQNPSKWVNDQSQAIEVTAIDRGLGVFGLTAKTAKNTGGTTQWDQNVGCVGNVTAPCPRKWNGGFWNYDPKAMPQGEQWVEMTAKDPIGRTAKGTARIKVDHSAPALSLAGNLTEQGSVGTKLPEYTLNYSATDGDEVTAAPQTPFGTGGTAAGQLERPIGVVADASGNVWVSDRVNNRLIEYDKNGTYLRQIAAQGSGDGQIKDPRGIEIGSNGNIWVAETGNKRLQQFTPTGTFVSKLTNAAFVEPWGIARGGGLIWVTDPGAGKIFQFKEDGSLVRTLDVSKVVKLGALNGPPVGIDVDAFGNAWVAIQGSNQIIEVAPDGSLIFNFGGEGTEAGKFKGPLDVAVAPSGNLLVSDDLNNRVQVFETDGTFLRQFGTTGSANGQFKEPRALDVGPDGQLFVADSANRRIGRWIHADQDPQSGTAKVEVKVDGSAAKTEAPGCATKNCSIASSWTLDADNYSVGTHKVEVIATDGVGLATTKTLNIETHGDLQAPSVALSGSMTEQASLGTTRPAYTLKAVATDPGSAEERKSGVVSTTIKVDGKTVDSASPGCPAGGCSITREWTLDSNSYSVGSHGVEVKATDDAGRSTTKTLTINIARDTTAPEFNLYNTFYTAPEGWLEQKSYNYNATSNDEGGYGVVSMTLKIDGAVIKSVSGTCPAGGCSRLFGFGPTIDMSSYGGGAHPAELIAVDGAGNTRKRTWTINVVPKGEVPAVEATDTLEALEETTEATPVASADELLEPEQMEEGDNPSLVDVEDGFESRGVPDVTAIDGETAAITISGPEDSMVIEPVELPAEGPSPTTSEDLAAVIPDVATNTDAVVRPQYNGAMQFSQIRDASSPESYAWQLKLDPDQYLVLANEMQAEVRYEGGKTAYLITAELAHDATGKAVATSLSVAGNVITLKVNHRVSGIVYPVLAGQSYETSYETGTVAMPPDEPPPPPASGYFTEAEAAEVIASSGVGEEIIPAPEPSPSGSGATASSIPEKVVKPFRICANISCGYWHVELKNPSYHYKRNSNGRLTAYWQAGTEVHSNWWYPWYYAPELNVQGWGCGFTGPSQVWGGEHQHLTVWGRYKIVATLFTPGGDYFEQTNNLGLQIWVWPNGFQERKRTEWEETIQAIEAAQGCH